MILVDTSIWVDHFSRTDSRLLTLLRSEHILGHPFVTGEIACGSPPDRVRALHFLDRLPQAVRAHDADVLRMIDNTSLMGSGIGYLDAHLLASTLLTRNATFWTRDKRLAAAATRLGIAA